MAVHFKIQIEAQPEAVFDYLSDMKRHTEWANPKAKMTMEEVSGGAPALGSKYRSGGIFVGKPTTADIEVTRFDRPRVFAYRLAQHFEGKKDTHFEHTYTLAPADGGTNVEKMTWSDGNPVVGFIAYPAIRGDAMTSLRNLKAKLESAPRG